MLLNLWMEFGQYLLNKQKTEKIGNEEREREGGKKREKRKEGIERKKGRQMRKNKRALKGKKVVGGREGHLLFYCRVSE